MKVLVVGSTGMVGGEVCRQLSGKGVDVRAFVRPTSAAEKVDALKKLGAEVVVGNVRERASLDAACKGVDAVINTTSALPVSYNPAENNIQQIDVDGVSALFEAAKAAGAGQVTYTSFTRNIVSGFPLSDAKRTVEKHLKGSGLTYTILRPGYFMQGWLSPMVGFDYPNAKARIYGDGKRPVSWIDFRDVAAFAVESLENPAARNATLELGGPEALTPLEVVGIFEQVGGRKFELEFLPDSIFAEQLKTVDDPFQKSFAGLIYSISQGDPIDMAQKLKDFPLRLRSVREYANEVLRA